MIRVLFGVLAIAFVVMVLLLDIPLGYLVLIGVALAVAFGATAFMLRRQRQDAAPDLPREGKPRDDLQSLGIMDIRPREQKPRTTADAPEHEPAKTTAGEETQASASTETAPEDATSAATHSRQGSSQENASEQEPDDPMKARPKKKPSASASTSTEKEPHGEPTDDDPVAAQGTSNSASTPEAHIFHPLLTSLKAALDAHTVCLLKQKDLALEYYIETLTSDHAEVRTDERFVTRAPLLTATMAQRPVSVRHVGKSGIPRASLGYYTAPVAVQQVALAPVPRADALATHFLVADTLEKDAIGSQFHRTLLAQYAELISTVLDEIEETEEPLHEDGESVRPRREIIEEEMAAARDEGIPLAFALIHLNRAEELADDGLGAVNSAERALRRRLDDATPHGRVERFGELTFGVFQYDHLSQVESWATRLQQDLDRETGILEGGISIGVVMLDERHESADTFRAEATTALQESYVSGACIIVE